MLLKYLITQGGNNFTLKKEFRKKVIALVLFGGFFLPIGFLILKSFFYGTDSLNYILENLLFEYSINTLKLILITCIFSIIFGVFPAWYVSNYKFFGRSIIDLLLLLPLAVPTYIMAFSYSEILSFTGPFKITVDLIQPEILGILLSFSLFPYIYSASRISFSLLGDRYQEISKNLGINKTKYFFTVVIPLSKPALFSGLFLVIMEVLNEYGAVKYFGVNTYTIGIFRAWNSMNDTGAAIQLSSILLFIVSFLFFLEKSFNKNKRFSSAKNSSVKKLMKTKILQKILIYIFCLTPIIFAFIIPVGFNLVNLIDDFQSIEFLNLFRLTINSISVSLFTSIFVVLISILFLYGERQSKSRLYYYINEFISLGYSIPGAVVALSIIIFFTSIDSNLAKISILGGFLVYLFMLIYAYIIRFMAVGKTTLKAGFDKLPYSYDNTAKVLGLSDFNFFKKVLFPLNKLPLLSALILVFIDIMKELPITLILRPFNFDTLATQTFEFAIDEMIPKSAIYSLSIILICSLLLVLFKKLLDSLHVSGD